MEIRKQNGEEYPRETLYEIVLSLQHYMTMNGRELKLLDHPGLIKMHNTLDNYMKQLSKQGVIRECQQAKPISVKEEDYLWNTGLLSDDTPEKLINMLLYLIGLHFALCECNEHKALKVGFYSQLRIKMHQESWIHWKTQQKFSRWNSATQRQTKNCSCISKSWEARALCGENFWKVSHQETISQPKMLQGLVL